MAASARVALVTGAATGLGRQVAIALAEAGFDVVVNYRASAEAAQGLCEAITARGRQSLAVQADVGDAAQVEALLRQVEARFAGVDVLVNGAGPFIRPKVPMAALSLAEWREMIEGNLSSAFYVTRGVLPGMRARRWGRVINVGFGGVAAAPGWPGRSAYAAAKAGLVSLTRSLAAETAPHGITVNMVCPGDIVQPYKERSIEDARGVADPRTPVGRPGTGEDIARVIRFLCSPDSDLITGAIIDVTGGVDVLDR